MRCVLVVLVSLSVACGSPAAPMVAHDEPDVGEALEPLSAPPAPSGFRGERFRTEPISRGGVLFIPRATVCVPPEAADGRALPVLYALDGDYFVDTLDLCGVVARLVDEGALAPWVVVSVGSTERREATLAGRPDLLATSVIETLEPMVAAHVTVAPGREHRAVVGYSYGGLAAIRFGLSRPDDFGRIVAMSPSLWFAGRSTLRDFRRSHAALPVRLYLDAGAREGDPGDVVPYMIDDVRRLGGIARTRGMRFGRDLAMREVLGQSHDMALARERLPGALRFALADEVLDEERPVSVSIDVFDRSAETAPATFSVDATYANGVVLSWPIDLVEVRLAGAPLERAQLASDAHELSATVHGVTATR